MTREEEIRKVAHFNATKFSTRYGYTTPEEACVQTALWADEHPKNPWISLSERVPEPKKRVLFLDNKGAAHFGYNNIDRKGATIFTTDANAPGITHWMPIPTLNPAEQLISGLQEMNKQFEKGGK